MTFPFRSLSRRGTSPAQADGSGAPAEPLLGAALVVLTVLATLKDWVPGTPAGLWAAWCVPLVVALLALRLRGRRLGFVVVALLVTAAREYKMLSSVKTSRV